MKIMSVTSGKGGVGKTTITCNLAMMLSSRGNRVLILDGDVGMANVDIFFGVRPVHHISDVISGEKKIQQVIVEAAKNVDVIPGGSGIYELNSLNHFQRRHLIESARELENRYDYMLIDTAPGISDNVLYLNSCAEEVMVVLTSDPASFADSYALIKVLHQKYKLKKFSVLVNNVKDEKEGAVLFQKFFDVVSRFLFVRLDYVGTIMSDTNLRRAVQLQRLIVRQEPEGPAARAFNQLAEQIERRTRHSQNRDQLSSFFEQVVGIS